MRLKEWEGFTEQIEISLPKGSCLDKGRALAVQKKKKSSLPKSRQNVVG